jgi:hypothetical protein
VETVAQTRSSDCAHHVNQRAIVHTP